MKFNKTAKAIAVILALVFLAAQAAGCGSSGGGGNQAGETATQKPAEKQQSSDSSESAASETAAEAQVEEENGLEPLDVTYWLWGEKPYDMDMVLDEFYDRTKDILNMKLSINWTPLEDYGSLIKLKLSAGEAVDGCFDAQWINMTAFIAEGNYYDLTDYFLNDKYPGLKYAFDANYLNNNTLGTGRNYGVPFSQSFGVAPLFAIRGDLREKYGAPKVVDIDTFKQYLEAIKTNEPNMVPYAASPSTWATQAILMNELTLQDLDAKKKGVFLGAFYTAGIPAFSVYIEDYQVKALASQLFTSDFAGFPEPYNENALTMYYAEFARDFYENGYMDKDLLTVTDTGGQFTAGRAASVYWDTANYQAVKNALAASVPEAVLEIYQPDPIYRQGLLGRTPGAYQVWNFFCVPVTTPQNKLDRIMMFFDWMYTSKENHDLFERGVEGKHFVPIGDDMFKIPDGVDPATNYVMYGYQLTWNPNFIRLSADYPDEVVKYITQCNDPENYYDWLLSGFQVVRENIETQMANPDLATYSTMFNNITIGVVPNPKQAILDLEEEIRANSFLMDDINVIYAEIEKQLQEYLDWRKDYDRENNIVYSY